MPPEKAAPSPIDPADGPQMAPAKPADQDALDVNALAKGVLARDFRPRASTVRRLAEAVLAKDAKSAKSAKKKKAKGAKSSAKSGKNAGKKRVLARIPGQKKK